MSMGYSNLNRKPDDDNCPSPVVRPLFLLFSIFLCTTSISSPLWADQQGGQRPAAYLEMGVGGPQEAMGGAAAAARNDVACGYWNPAGLTGLRGFQCEAQYTFLSFNQQLDYLALADNFQNFLYYGLSFIYYSAGNDLEARSGPSLNPDSTFGDTEMTFLFSLAYKVSPRWSIGANLKVLTLGLGSFSGYGFGEDMGIQYRVDNDTSVGFMVQDPYTSLSYSNSNSDVQPPTFKGGIAHWEEKVDLKGNFDIEWSDDLGLRPRIGLEWRPMGVLALRGGCWAGDLTGGTSGGSLSLNLSGGLGILVPYDGNVMEFDYTVLQDPLMAGSVLHQLTLTGKFL